MTDQEIIDLRAQALAGSLLAEQAITLAAALAMKVGITIDYASMAATLRLSDPVDAEGTALDVKRRANELAAQALERFIW